MNPEEQKYLEHRDREIIAHFSRGVSVESLCASYDLSEEEIREIVRKAIKRVKKRHLDFRTEPITRLNAILKQVTKLGKQGKDSRYISDKLGVSLKDIRDIMREFNIKVYVQCRDCGELVDRSKRNWRFYCAKCRKQRIIDSIARRQRFLYKNDPAFREKMNKKDKDYRANLKKRPKESTRKP